MQQMCQWRNAAGRDEGLGVNPDPYRSVSILLNKSRSLSQ
jgi:hypothetical protein